MFCVHDLYNRRIGGPNRKLKVLSFRQLPDNLIAMIEEDDFPKFLANHAIVQSYAETIEVDQYQPRPLELILAKDESNSQWYRCALIKSDAKAVVYALDWGHNFEAEFKNIRVSENIRIFGRFFQ